MITSLSRQNDVATSFRRNSDAITMGCFIKQIQDDTSLYYVATTSHNYK